MESLLFLELAVGDILAYAVELNAPVDDFPLKLSPDQKGAFRFHCHNNPL